MTDKIYWRCGACGNLYRLDGKPITAEELEFGILDCDTEIAYDGCEDNTNRHQVTRDMAMDAGDLSLEGQWI